MNKTLGALALVSSLGACAAQDLQEGGIPESFMGFMGEDSKNPDITYWEADTPMESDEVLAVQGIICDRLQPIFDKTTGQAYTFIPEDIVTSAQEHGDETIIICEDKGRDDI